MSVGAVTLRSSSFLQTPPSVLRQHVYADSAGYKGKDYFCSLVLFEVFFFVKDDVEFVSDFQLVVNADCFQLEPRPPQSKKQKSKKSGPEQQIRNENYLLRAEIQP